MAFGRRWHYRADMWWHKTRRAEPESAESDGQLRAQIVEACKNLRHQIEVQQSVRFSRGGGYGGDDLAVQVLQTQLDQLEESLASLGPNDA